MGRRHAASGTEWESTIGYPHAVRIGDTIHVSGTAAIDEDGEVVAGNDPGGQTHRALAAVGDALESVDASLEDVGGTRVFVTAMETWEAVGEVHGESSPRSGPPVP